MTDYEVDPLEEAAYRVLAPGDGPGETARVVNLDVAQHIRDEAVRSAVLAADDELQALVNDPTNAAAAVEGLIEGEWIASRLAQDGAGCGKAALRALADPMNREVIRPFLREVGLIEAGGRSTEPQPAAVEPAPGGWHTLHANLALHLADSGCLWGTGIGPATTANIATEVLTYLAEPAALPTLAGFLAAAADEIATALSNEARDAARGQ